MTGKVHSFQSFGTLDGPGVRAVLFMQGCPLRCICCHNPDTWNKDGGTDISIDEAYRKIVRCKAYFGDKGGVTVTGGEPLLQSDFVYELFCMLKADGIHTALDTSGCMLNDSVKRLLTVTDLVLLDYKYTNETDYKKYTGCDKKFVDKFLEYLNEQHKKTWIRQVIIPLLNDNDESARILGRLQRDYECISRIELLPFRKLCIEKYEAMNRDFPLKNTPETNEETIARLYSKLKQ